MSPRPKMMPRVLQLGEGKRGAPATPEASGASPSRPGPKRVHVHAEPNIPKGGSQSSDKVCSQKINIPSDKGTGINVLSRMEDSGSDSDDVEDYGSLPDHEKRMIDLMQAANSGNEDARRILYEMGFTRDDG